MNKSLEQHRQDIDRALDAIVAEIHEMQRIIKICKDTRSEE